MRWVYLLGVIVFCAGCAATTGLPDFGADGRPAAHYFPKDIPVGYGPRANECKERKADGEIEGIAAKIVGDTLELTWSELCENKENLPATATVNFWIHCAYGSNGKQNQFTDADSVLVMPHATRLAKGTIKIPLANIEVDNLGSIVPEKWFDRRGFTREWSGILVGGPDAQLEFVWAGEDPDGFVRLRWISRLTSVTHKSTVTARNAAPATTDSGAYDIEVVCVLIDKDGKTVATDKATVDGKAGAKEAAGWFRIKMSDALNIDWNKCKADWTRMISKKNAIAPKKIKALVSSYCPCSRCTDGDGITRSGHSAWTRGFATDPRAIPEGAIVVVPGYGKAIVDDTGSAMKRSYEKGIVHIDVRVKYHWQARQWGRQWLECEVL